MTVKPPSSFSVGIRDLSSREERAKAQHTSQVVSRILGNAWALMLGEEPKVPAHLFVIHRGPLRPRRRTPDVDERRVSA
jgi:hypothetical protein